MSELTATGRLCGYECPYTEEGHRANDVDHEFIEVWSHVESGIERDQLRDLANAARVYANVVEERYHGRTGWASVAEARSLLLSALAAAPAADRQLREREPQSEWHRLEAD